MHDESIQSMVAVGMRLQLLASRLPEPHASAVTGLDESGAGRPWAGRGLVSSCGRRGLNRHSLVEAVSGCVGGASRAAGGWRTRCATS